MAYYVVERDTAKTDRRGVFLELEVVDGPFDSDAEAQAEARRLTESRIAAQRRTNELGITRGAPTVSYGCYSEAKLEEARDMGISVTGV
jgi:hypothetical protein